MIEKDDSILERKEVWGGGEERGSWVRGDMNGEK